jgi:O-Antigen ligase
VRPVAAACLLCAPTVLAFFSGGFFAEPRLIAAIVIWSLVLAMAVVGDTPLPRGLPGRLALGGLVALTAWTGLSIAWAPLGGPAVESLQRLVLYVGALMLGIGALRSRTLLRAVEPGLAGGAVIVIGYGLAGRLLPGILDFDRSESAGGRLEQPITYWNAEGALAALGLVLSAHLAADRSRPVAVRALAAAAAVPLGTGVYLSFSRGAIAAAAVGLLLLVALAPTAGQLRAVGVALGAGAAAATVAGLVPAVASLEGSERSRDGALVLVALVAIAAAAALVTSTLARRAPAGEEAAPPWLRHARPLAAAAVAAVACGLVIGGLGEKPSAADLSAGAEFQRLTKVSSNRYEYWRVGLNAFESAPLAGVGAGGFRVEWLRERVLPESVRDAHSIEVEIAAELGLVGLLAFAVLIAGVVMAARAAQRADPGLSAGWCAALVVWLLHASIDWDFQLPAVTLPAVALVGALVALSDERSADPAGAGRPLLAVPWRDRSRGRLRPARPRP